MKKIKILLLVLCIVFLFSGCSSFRLATSIDDLISPISPSGDNAGVQNAVDEYCKGGYLIKIPSSGDYATSFVFYDLDGDEQDEAIAFYEPSSALGTVNMAVLNKNADGKWSVVDNIQGNGTAVHRVDFSDVNNDGNAEIIVCWSLISKSTNFNLEVYRYENTDGSYSLAAVDDPVTAGEFICADVNDDGANELLVFTVGTSSESARAALYSFKNNEKRLLGETKLDGTISSFSTITAGKTDEGTSVYADAVRSDGNSMVTELIYWSNYYDSIVSPFYSYSTGRTKETARSSMISSKDIDGDGVIEIPTDEDVSSLPEQITAQSWVKYESTVLKHKCYSYSCKRDGYSLIVDDKLFSKVNVEYDNDRRELTVLNDEQVCFGIVTVLKSAYNPSEYKDYEEIFSNSGFVYLAKTDENSDINITIDDLKNMIKSY